MRTLLFALLCSVGITAQTFDFQCCSFDSVIDKWNGTVQERTIGCPNPNHVMTTINSTSSANWTFQWYKDGILTDNTTNQTVVTEDDVEEIPNFTTYKIVVTNTPDGCTASRSWKINAYLGNEYNACYEGHDFEQDEEYTYELFVKGAVSSPTTTLGYLSKGSACNSELGTQDGKWLEVYKEPSELHKEIEIGDAFFIDGEIFNGDNDWFPTGDKVRINNVVQPSDVYVINIDRFGICRAVRTCP